MYGTLAQFDTGAVTVPFSSAVSSEFQTPPPLRVPQTTRVIGTAVAALPGSLPFPSFVHVASTRTHEIR